MFDQALQLAGVGVLVIGAITLLTWLRPVPPGWVCWTVATSGGGFRACEPAKGWHLETWPGAGQVSVPDRAPGRRWVRD